MGIRAVLVFCTQSLSAVDASLYDVLTGRFVGDRPFDSVSPDRHLKLSVLSNLNRLFNSRQGSIQHLPDYGLPDIMTVYRDAPRSADTLRRAIRETIKKYEPRLRRVHVKRKETDVYEMRLVFIVNAELKTGERVQFETTFESQDSARVTPVGSYL